MNRALKNKIAACAACVILAACVLFAAPQAVFAHATQPSPPPEYPGVRNAGAYPAGNSPIGVESALLTYDISDFPAPYELGSYSSAFTAEYTLRNPEAEDASVRVLLPFGGLPEYGEDGKGVPFDDSSFYTVTAGGEEHEFSFRLSHTQNIISSYFDFNTESAALRDTPIENEFGVTPQTEMYVYYISVERGDCVNITYSSFEGCAITDGGAGTFDGQTEMYFTENGFVAFACGVPSDIKFVYSRDVYTGQGVIEDSGEGEEFFPKPVEGSSFSQFIAQYLPPYLSDVGGTDWFNFVLAAFGQNHILHPAEIEHDARYNCMRWLEYELMVPAGETLVTAVTVPVYPAINYDTEPYSYTYRYMHFGAGGWANFGQLTVRVNYGGYMIEDYANGFVSEGGGYSATFDGLLRYDYNFTLCSVAEPSPAPEEGPYEGNWGWAIVAIFAVLMLLIGLFCSAFIIIPMFVVAIPAFAVGIIVTILLVHRDKRKYSDQKNNNKK